MTGYLVCKVIQVGEDNGFAQEQVLDNLVAPLDGKSLTQGGKSSKDDLYTGQHWSRGNRWGTEKCDTSAGGSSTRQSTKHEATSLITNY